MTQKPFGRRVHEPSRSPPSAPPRVHVSRVVDAIDARSISQASLARSETGPTSDDELRDWKRARRQSYQLPWRQLSLMASLCFGVASLVLPDTVSDTLDWTLYSLMVTSFVAGVRRRREASNE